MWHIRPINWLKAHMYVLDIAKFVLIVILLVMAVQFNIRAAAQAKQTQQIANATNALVKSQGGILTAIKQVTVDNKLTSKQQTDIIICMLQVPVEERTVDLGAECRKQATASPTTSATPPVSPQKQSSVPSPNPTPAPAPAKQENVQPAKKSTFKKVCGKLPVVNRACK